MLNRIRVERQIGKGKISFETGALAKQASGCVLVQYGETVTLSAPFTYSGTILGFLEKPLTRGSDALPVFATSLVGRGLASAAFTFVDLEGLGPTFTATDLRYDFAATEPVPEPATIVLVGSGAAALVPRRRAPRRRSP